jgi:hypothetical protein
VQEEDDTSISFAALACPPVVVTERSDEPPPQPATLTVAPRAAPRAAF